MGLVLYVGKGRGFIARNAMTSPPRTKREGNQIEYPGARESGLRTAVWGAVGETKQVVRVPVGRSLTR